MKKSLALLLVLIIAQEVVAAQDQFLLPLDFKSSVSALHAHANLITRQRQPDILSKFANAISFVKDHYRDLLGVTALFNNNVSEPCTTQLKQFAWALLNKDEWALKVLDSFAKPPSGILYGDLAWLGEFTECRSVRAAYAGDWTGKYCLLAQPLDSFDMTNNTPWSILSFKYGACVPNTCSQDDIASLINNVLAIFNYSSHQISPLYVQFQGEAKRLDSIAILAICILCSLMTLVLVGTLYDLKKRRDYESQYNCQVLVSSPNTSATVPIIAPPSNEEQQQQQNHQHHHHQGMLTSFPSLDGEKLNKTIIFDSFYSHCLKEESTLCQILIEFSAFTNTKKVFKKIDNDGHYTCLHGIRFLSIAWIILGHTFVCNLLYADNFLNVYEWLKYIPFMLISNSLYSVDSFFLLSGLLTYYAFMRELERRNYKLTLGFLTKYYIHRYWRLVPVYALTLMTSACLSSYFGQGPLYPPNGFESNRCRDIWWTNLLFINNFYKPEEMCFPVSWYLANDMQFYWIAPILILPLVFRKYILAVIVAMLMLVAHVSSIFTTMMLDDTDIEVAQYGTSFNDFWKKIYIKPWCRIGPYIVGLLTGFTLYNLRKHKIAVKLSRHFNMSCWFLAIKCFIFVIFAVYPNTTDWPLPRLANIVYQSFSRLIWAVALAYVIFACCTSNGGVVNRFLSWKIWIPLSRLTYCAFLIHTTMIIYFNSILETRIHMQGSTIAQMFVSNLVLSFVMAFFMTIFFEMPLIGLEKILLRK